VRPEQNTKLYRSYVLENAPHDVLRHRGKSPRQAAFFFRNGNGRGVEPRYRVGSLESGALLCRAYEAYLEMHTPAGISFEHAWFLLLALARHDEVGIARCEICGGVRVRDLLAKHRLDCGNCEGHWLRQEPQEPAPC